MLIGTLCIYLWRNINNTFKIYLLYIFRNYQDPILRILWFIYTLAWEFPASCAQGIIVSPTDYPRFVVSNDYINYPR